MKSDAGQIKPIIETILNTSLFTIEKLPHVANNTVYKVESDKRYIFKLYKSAS